jgi:hypothetical protein
VAQKTGLKNVRFPTLTGVHAQPPAVVVNKNEEDRFLWDAWVATIVMWNTGNATPSLVAEIVCSSNGKSTALAMLTACLQFPLQHSKPVTDISYRDKHRVASVSPKKMFKSVNVNLPQNSAKLTAELVHGAIMISAALHAAVVFKWEHVLWFSNHKGTALHARISPRRRVASVMNALNLADILTGVTVLALEIATWTTPLKEKLCLNILRGERFVTLFPTLRVVSLLVTSLVNLLKLSNARMSLNVNLTAWFLPGAPGRVNAHHVFLLDSQFQLWHVSDRSFLWEMVSVVALGKRKFATFLGVVKTAFLMSGPNGVLAYLTVLVWKDLKLV